MRKPMFCRNMLSSETQIYLSILSCNLSVFFVWCVDNNDFDGLLTNHLFCCFLSYITCGKVLAVSVVMIANSAKLHDTFGIE